MASLEFLAQALTPLHFSLALFGVIAGTVVGALPGLTAAMAIAVLVPITFVMTPTAALIVMGAIYTGAIYGGAYSAILLKTPGTPSAIATTFDGYPMAKRGRGDLAMTLACLASVTGGFVGAVALLTLSPPLAKIALKFGPAEYFWLAVLGLTLISVLSEGQLLKGLIGGCFGMLLSTVGVGEVAADVRFTFDTHFLLGGIEVIAALIGLYCIPVLLDLVATPAKHLEVASKSRGFRLAEGLRIYWRSKFNVARSSVLGTIIGILPGAGGAIAGLVSYAEARRASPHPERFGKGEPDGVIASESANNATVGGGLIPTLVLGIPGTPPDAVILGALLIQGLKPGPKLFTEQAHVVYTFTWSLFIATLLMLPTGLVIGRYAYRTIISVPKALLVPAVAFMTLIGTYAIRNNIWDVYIMVGLGVIAWILNLFGFPISPIVLGVILGSIAEQGFVQAWIIGKAKGSVLGMFFGRPISIGIILFIVLTLFYPVVVARLKPWEKLARADDEETP